MPQFEHINAQIKAFQAKKQPAISVDTKKKELVGDFKNGGRELRPKGNPELVRVHDFKIPELGKAAPYGVYDIAANAGWVSVGIDHDTAAFAVESIRRWWHELGQVALSTTPSACSSRLTAAAATASVSGCGSGSCRQLANEIGVAITVAHLPPGTSKWNRIEHRLFAFITQNWRGKPLVSHQVIGAVPVSTPQTQLSKNFCAAFFKKRPLSFRPAAPDDSVAPAWLRPAWSNGGGSGRSWRTRAPDRRIPG